MPNQPEETTAQGVGGWFDSHCHVHLCEEEEEGVRSLLARADAAQVTGIVAVGIDAVSSKKSIEIAQRHSLYATAGVHPNSASKWDGQTATEMEALLKEDCCVAVGETGLDYYRHHSPPDVQRPVFSAHIDLAKRYDKALVIHTRASVTEALDILLADGPPQRLVFHCWSGTSLELRRALDLGAYISFAGNISFPSANELRDVSTKVPLNRLLVETDSPFLTPVPFRGKPNEPARLALVGEALAGARGEASEIVANQTAGNARRLFAIDERSAG